MYRTIEDAMKDESIIDIRLSCGNRWMYWDETGKCWVVMSHEYHQRTKKVIETVNLLTALLNLTG